eukprot:jgi/Botrbrau1/15209/Bobra.0149s0068.1
MSLRFRQLEKLERVREETESLQRELDAREDVIKSAGSPKSGPDASGQPSRGSAGRKSLRERVHVGEPGGLAGRNFKSIDAGTPSAHGALPADFGMPRDTHVFAPQGETALHDLQNAALFEESISSGAPAARIGDAHWLAAKRRSGDLRYRYLIPPDYVAVGGAAQGGLPGSAVQGDGAPGGFHRSAVQHQPTAEATAPEDTANVQDFEKTELVGRGEPHDDLAEDLWDWEGVSRRPAVSREAPANRKKGAPRRRKGAPAPSAGQEKRPRVDKAASGELAGQATMGPSLADVLAHGPDEPLLLREEGPDPSSGTALEKVVPASINRYLRGYQREGVRFLFRQYAKGEGGILADDMGLGKTVQTIAFVAAILPSPVSTAPAPPNSQATPTRSGPVLIVVPTSLLTNWEREFNMWGTFRIAIYHGINRGASLTAAASGNLQVLLTSYDTVRLYIEDLLTVDWHVVICDEAHRLKNDRSKIYSCASKFPTKLRYGLTGTPMQNSYEELWTLLEWARPGALGSASQFREYYAKPLKEGQRSDADLRMLAKAKKRQVQLTKVLNKYLLRRTKEGSIKDQLPTKTDHIVFCALSPLQARAYRRCLNQVDFQRLIRASEECGCGSRLTQAMCCRPGSHGELFRIQHLCECQEPVCRLPWPGPPGGEGLAGSHGRAHTRARTQACKWHSGEDGCDFCPYCIMFRCVRVLECVSNHLDLVKVDRSLANDGSAGAGRRRLLARMVLGEDEEAAGGLLLDDAFLSTPLASSTCGKMAALQNLLAVWFRQGNNKVLVFSRSVRMLDLIERSLVWAGYKYTRLDGKTPQQERQRRVDDFNYSPALFVFLISTPTGGLGLNLTSANKVVVVDPSWNPAQDLQAQDRAFRIGQRRDVAVYRLISAGSLEELAYRRQVYKQQQSRLVLEGSVQQRHFKGVQPSRGQQTARPGELFGLQNLLKFTADVWTADTDDITEPHRPGEPGFWIEQYDPQGTGDDGAEVGEGVTRSKSRPQEDEADALRAAGIVRGLQDHNALVSSTAAELALSRKAMAAAQRLELQLTSTSHSSQLPFPLKDALLHVEQEAGLQQEDEEAGPLGDTGSRPQRRAREDPVENLVLGEVLGLDPVCEDPLVDDDDDDNDYNPPGGRGAAGSSPQVQGVHVPNEAILQRRQLSQLESLATWRGLSTAGMAHQLLVMPLEDVRRLMNDYCTAQRNIIATALGFPEEVGHSTPG